MKQPKPVSHDSYNEGAAEERRLWIRKIRAQIKLHKQGCNIEFCTACEMELEPLLNLLAYGEGRTKRNKAKKGGL